MGQYDSDNEPTHSIPVEVERALVRAKEWYDREPALATGTRAGLEREDWDREAISFLQDIVEAIDRTWGFAESFPRGQG